MDAFHKHNVSGKCIYLLHNESKLIMPISRSYVCLMHHNSEKTQANAPVTQHNSNMYIEVSMGGYRILFADT
jgi:hypothetical protein